MMASGAVLAAKIVKTAATSHSVANGLRETFSLFKHAHEAHQIYNMLGHFYGVEGREMDILAEDSEKYHQDGHDFIADLGRLCGQLTSFRKKVNSSRLSNLTTIKVDLYLMTKDLNVYFVIVRNWLIKIATHNRKIFYITSQMGAEFNANEYNMLLQKINCVLNTAITSINSLAEDIQRQFRVDSIPVLTTPDDQLSLKQRLENAFMKFRAAIEQLEFVLMLEDMHQSNMPDGLLPPPLITAVNIKTVGRRVFNEILDKDPQLRYKLINLLLRPPGCEGVGWGSKGVFYYGYYSVVNNGVYRRLLMSIWDYTNNTEAPPSRVLSANKQKEYLYYQGLVEVLENYYHLAEKLLIELQSDQTSLAIGFISSDELRSKYRFEGYGLTPEITLQPLPSAITQGQPLRRADNVPLPEYMAQIIRWREALIHEERISQITRWREILTHVERQQPQIIGAIVTRGLALAREVQPSVLVQAVNSNDICTKKKMVEWLKEYLANLQVQIISFKKSIALLQAESAQLMDYKKHSKRIQEVVSQYADQCTGMISKDDFMELVWRGLEANPQDEDPVFYDNRLLHNDLPSLELFLSQGGDPTLKSKQDNELLKGGSLLDYFSRSENDEHLRNLLHHIIRNLPYFLRVLSEREDSAAFLYSKLDKVDSSIAKLRATLLDFSNWLLWYIPQGRWYEYGYSCLFPVKSVQVTLLRGYLLSYKKLILAGNRESMIAALDDLQKISAKLDKDSTNKFHILLASDIKELQKLVNDNSAVLDALFVQRGQVRETRSAQKTASSSSVEQTNIVMPQKTRSSQSKSSRISKRSQRHSRLWLEVSTSNQDEGAQTPTIEQRATGRRSEL